MCVQILYVLPFFGGTFSYICYRRLLLAAMVHFLVMVFHQHGRPKWNTQYAAAVFQNPASNFFFMALMFYTARPRALALVPVRGGGRRLLHVALRVTLV